MTTTTTSETDAADKGTKPETGEPAGTTPPTPKPETGAGGGTETEPTEEEGRLKFLRGKLDEATTELAKLRQADEDRKRAEMTESDKLKADLETSAAETVKLRRQVIAARHGLDEEIAARLVGSTEEELEADAAKLAERFGKPAKKPTTPAGDAGVGVTGGDDIPLDPLEAHRKWTGKA